jgi:hypothetical protein
MPTQMFSAYGCIPVLITLVPETVQRTGTQGKMILIDYTIVI